MAEAQEYALAHHFGDSFEGVSVQWTDSAGTPKDITGYLASMKVRDSDGLELLHLDSDTKGGLTVDGATGTVYINATAPKMKSGTLVTGNHSYDLQVKSADGLTIKTLLKGDFVVHEEKTDV